VVVTRIETGWWQGEQNWDYPKDKCSELYAALFSPCSNTVITALLQLAALRSTGPYSGKDHRATAGHEASVPHTAVDTVIPMTRGGDKLRTVCGRLRRNTAA
jgi:hypothetical protein